MLVYAQQMGPGDPWVLFSCVFDNVSGNVYVYLRILCPMDDAKTAECVQRDRKEGMEGHYSCGSLPICQHCSE